MTSFPEFTQIRYSVGDRISQVVLDRPGKHNVLSPAHGTLAHELGLAAAIAWLDGAFRGHGFRL